MTRTLRALGAKCGGRGAEGRSGGHWGRMGARPAPSSFCSASSDRRAMPPRPVPPKRRKSRRLSSQRPACEGVRSIIASKEVNKFVRVEQRAAKHRQALLLDQFRGGIEFSALGLALEGQGKGPARLRLSI